jgi:hypothetical protein
LTHIQKQFDGFYATYLTGAMGSTFAVFTFFDANVVGADAGGGKYDGTYTVDEINNTVHCVINFRLSPGQISITGAFAGEGPIDLTVPLALPIPIDPSEVYRIDTPIGPINAKFEKIRNYGVENA